MRRHRKQQIRIDTKTLYRIVRELTSARSNSNVPIKNKNGNIMLTAEEQDVHWVEYFTEMLSQPDPTFILHFSATPPEKLNVNMGPITEKETQGVVQTLKNNKTLRLDWITVELMKCSGPSMIKELT